MTSVHSIYILRFSRNRQVQTWPSVGPMDFRMTAVSGLGGPYIERFVERRRFGRILSVCHGHQMGRLLSIKSAPCASRAGCFRCSWKGHREVSGRFLQCIDNRGRRQQKRVVRGGEFVGQRTSRRATMRVACGFVDRCCGTFEDCRVAFLQRTYKVAFCGYGFGANDDAGDHGRTFSNARFATLLDLVMQDRRRVIPW